MGERYRASSSTTARLVVALAAVLLLALIGWFVWALWFNVHPKVTSSAQTFPHISETEYSAVVDIQPAKGVELATIRCTAQVMGKDGSIVGQTTYTPTAVGAQTVTVRTLRLGAYFNWEGCTAPGQTDAR